MQYRREPRSASSRPSAGPKYRALVDFIAQSSISQKPRDLRRTFRRGVGGFPRLVAGREILVGADRGREAFLPPLPPTRTGGFPSYGSPVDGFLIIGTVSLAARPCPGRTAQRSRRICLGSVSGL